jgi:glycosyltransferase involved in cell wall biosynthesis
MTARQTMTTTNRHRVLHLMQSFDVGGLEKMVASLALEAMAAGHVAGVAAYAEDGPMRAVLREAGVPTWLLAYRGGADPTLSARLAWLLRREGFTHLHTHHLGPFLYGALAARAAGARHVHTEHSHEWYDTPRRRLAGRLMDVQARVACVSDEVARWREQTLGCPRSTVVPNGVPLEPTTTRAEARARCGLDDGAFVVGSVGRLAPEKGHRVLVDAFARVRDHLPHARLLLVGDGRERAALAARVRELELEEVVRFTGRVDDARDVLPALDVFALPSFREGLPLAVLEAAAQSVPFVASDVGALSQLARSGAGVVVPPGDVTALARALLSCAGDPVSSRRRGSAGRDLVVERFSVRAMVEGYEALYDEPHYDERRLAA